MPTNKYAAKCVNCNGQVEAETGDLARDAAGRWIVRHAGGECPAPAECLAVAGPGGDASVLAAVAPRERPAPWWHGLADKIRPGYYALTDGPDAERVWFYKVWHGGCEPGGEVYVGLDSVVGPESHRVSDPTRRRRTLLALAADPLAASALYGREVGACGVCGRRLTNPESRAVGIGPICRERLEN